MEDFSCGLQAGGAFEGHALRQHHTPPESVTLPTINLKQIRRPIETSPVSSYITQASSADMQNAIGFQIKSRDRKKNHNSIIGSDGRHCTFLHPWNVVTQRGFRLQMNS